MSRYEAREKARDWVVLDTEARITLVHYGCGKLGGRRDDMGDVEAGGIARATAAMLNAAHAAGLAEGTAKRYERMPFDEAVLMFDEAGVRCPRCKYPEPAQVLPATDAIAQGEGACEACFGHGYREVLIAEMNYAAEVKRVTCDACNGTGRDAQGAGRGNMSDPRTAAEAYRYRAINDSGNWTVEGDAEGLMLHFGAGSYACAWATSVARALDSAFAAGSAAALPLPTAPETIEALNAELEDMRRARRDALGEAEDLRHQVSRHAASVNAFVAALGLKVLACDTEILAEVRRLKAAEAGQRATIEAMNDGARKMVIEKLDPAPIPMVLHCPECGTRHVDVGEFATRVHHTHSCQTCGLTWRPAVVATVGVQFLPGFKNESSDVIDSLGLRHGIWISEEAIRQARVLGSVERLQELLRPRSLVAVEIPGQRTWRIEKMPVVLPCTGAAADWCPEHGDCTCEGGDGAPIDKSCPLHSDESSHPNVGAGT